MKFEDTKHNDPSVFTDANRKAIKRLAKLRRRKKFFLDRFENDPDGNGYERAASYSQVTTEIDELSRQLRPKLVFENV